MIIEHLLLIAAVVAIVASVWMTSERKTERRFKEDNRSRQPESPRQEDVNNRPSTDFAALINAIRNEAYANRQEQEREDRSQKFRDFVTNFILVATLVALSWTCYAIIQQVGEMQRVYPEIQKQATAAANQTSSFIASERARLFPIPDGLTRSGEKDRNPTISFKIVNLGRTTALVTGVSVECAVGPISVSSTPVYKLAKFSQALNVITGGSTLQLDGAHGCHLDSPISDEDFVALEAKTEFILIKGFVTFKDVFGNTWTQRFGLYSFGQNDFFPVNASLPYNVEHEGKEPDSS